MSKPTMDRFAGCLIGQALGDAYGFPVEGKPTALCADYVAALRRGERRGRRGYSFGQYTDDTQLARELLQSWVELGRFDPADFGRRVGAIFSEARIVGRGRATEAAAKALAAGTPWDQAGTHQRLRRRRRDLGLALNPENFWASLPFQGGTTWVALGRNRLGSRPKSCGAARLPPILRRCAKAAAIWAAKPPSNLLVEPTTQGRKL